MSDSTIDMAGARVRRTALLVGTALLLCTACSNAPDASAADGPADSAARSANAPAQCAAAARQLAQELGTRMRRVSVLAPDSALRAAIRDTYASLVSDSLVDQWIANPGTAPGREVSSPWPARIDIDTVTADAGGCHITGNVVYVTNADTTAIVSRRAVKMDVKDVNGWKIAGLDLAQR